MANEINLTASLAFAKGLIASIARGSTGIGRDVSGGDYAIGTQTIGLAAEALNLGDVATPGFLYVKNTDATNYVKVRAGAGGADVVRLNPGDPAIFRLATATPYLIADTAPVLIEFLLIAS